ncbi:hypothetical protein IW262DRAFT_901135 [Armillaria fumosa]|nr:hypothetical protein IW262DRAFT_901135 [Armillaria fumosa]
MTRTTRSLSCLTWRKFLQPTFDTIGELLECFQQLLEGVEFLHRHFIAHQDLTTLNIMLDDSQLCTKGFHPAKPRMNETFTGSAKHITRTECWPRYFIIDFGVYRRYSPPEISYEPVSYCGNRYVPEYIGSKEGDRCNRFPTDIFA